MTDKLKFKLKSAPRKPGCYLWKDEHNDIIYVGKAINLFNRVNQYFNKLHDFKTSQLVSNIADVEFYVVKNENEALILENNLIKKHRPKFNIMLKDSSGYPYIVVTNEKHPRIKYTRSNSKFKGTYYGPFASKNFFKKELLTLLGVLFPLRKCDQLPKHKCLYYDIGQCLGPCINKVDEQQYEAIKNRIRQFFNGNTSEVERQLKTRERQSADLLKFEEADYYKRLRLALNEIKENQTVQFNNKENIDFLGYATKDNLISLILFSYVGGKLVAKIQEIHEFYDDINSVISSWLYQYYIKSKNKPQHLFVSLPTKEFKVLKYTLGFEISKPVKGKKYEILMTAIDNAIEYLKTNYLVYQHAKKAKLSAMYQLADIIHAKKLKTIVSFDISNLFSTNKVAGMIYLNNGEFVKSKYRRYIIDDESLTSDYECMKYVLGRFIDHHKDEMPDLIIMDGGKIQVNAALETFALKHVTPPCIIGLVKNNNHQTNGIVYNNNTIKLDKESNLYNFLANIQNEVHNTAISFYRKKHEKSLFDTSIIPDIEGLSKAKKEMLLEKYRTTENIKKATISELSQILDIKLARALKKAL
ncbi:MAG: excinuclease ABC subunit UvrC [Mycoplasma sp.]|nr:excinuclease ABC subunit UvrC [Candidatus Hennigella equi]